MAWFVMRRDAPRDVEHTRSQSLATPASNTQAARELELPHDPAVTRGRAESVLTGVVTDSNGTVLEHARVWISSPEEAWAEGIVPPEIATHAGRVSAFEALTDARGRFELRAPAPSAARLRVDVESADHRGRASRDYASSTRAGDGVIAPGSNDLGTFELTLRASFGGEVRTRGGAPIANALVTRRSATEHTAGARTAPNGRYVFADVQAGEYSLDVSASRHLASSGILVTVRDNVELTDVDVELDAIPTISGRVVDESGEPVVKASVSFTNGSGITGADGAFVVDLTADREQLLEVNAPGFAPWQSWRLLHPPVAARTSGLEIHLLRKRWTHLRARDALTREPITVFGVDDDFEDVHSVVYASRAGELDGPRRSTDVPHAWLRPDEGVRIKVHAPPQRVIAWAPGYAPLVQQLDEANEQTLFFMPLGELSGTLSRDGAPCARASVVARPVHPRRAADWMDTLTDRDASETWPAHRSVPVDPPLRRVHANVDGSFRLAHLPPGEYALAALLDDDTRRYAIPLDVACVVRPDAETQLGELRIPTSRASLELRITLPAGTECAPSRFDPRLLDVQLEGQNTRLFAEPSRDANGARWLRDLLPGRWTITFDRDGDALRTWSIELAGGEARVLALDLSASPVCALRIEAVPGPAPNPADRWVVREAGANGRWIAGVGPSTPCLLLRGGSRIVVAVQDISGRELASTGEIELPRSGTRTARLRRP